MNKNIINYVIGAAFAFAIASSAMAMETKEEKAHFLSPKKFYQKVKELGNVTRKEAAELRHWAIKQYNHKLFGGPATTEEENSNAKRIMLTKGIPAAVITTLIIGVAVGGTIGLVRTGRYYKEYQKRKKLYEPKASERTGKVVTDNP